MGIIALIDALKRVRGRVAAEDAKARKGGKAGGGSDDGMCELDGVKGFWRTMNGSRIFIRASDGVAIAGNKNATEAFNGGAKGEGGAGASGKGGVDVSGLARKPAWAEAFGRLDGIPSDNVDNLVRQGLMMTDPKVLSRMRESDREVRAGMGLQLLASYLRKFGSEGGAVSKADFEGAQKNLAVFAGLKKRYPEFFADGFYDAVRGSKDAEKATAAERTKEIADLVQKADGLHLPKDAKALKEKIEAAIGKYGNAQELQGALAKAEAVARGGVPGVQSAKGKGGKAGAVVMDEPTFPASLDELVEIRAPASFAHGSTHPRLMVDRDGKKWVLKRGGADGHAQAEHECSSAYRALGIRAPASRMYGNLRLAEFVPGREFGEALRMATPDERERLMSELREGFAADVVMGNHDVLGMGLDNVMVGEDGHVWRVDNGGALGRRAQGGAADGWSDGWVDDLWTMRGMSPRLDGGGLEHDNRVLREAFGSMNTHEILQKAAEMPWERVIESMEQSAFAPGSNGGKGGKSRLTKGRAEVLKERVAEIRSLAAVSRCTVTRGHYTTTYDDDLLRSCYALMKTPYRELARAKAPGGGSYIYDNTPSGAGVVRQKVDGDFRSAHSASPLKSENLVHVNGSLDSIMRQAAKDHGVDLRRVDAMLHDQGISSSTGTKANDAKVHELHGLGYTLEQMADEAVPNLAEHVRERVADAARRYLAEGGERGSRFLADRKSCMFRKAATMMFASSAELPNYDPRTQTLLCMRTESPRQVARAGMKIGEVSPGYSRDSHASYSWFQTCKPYENDHLVAVAVPLSRITSMDVFCDENGRNLFNALNRDETEAGVNAMGLRSVYLGRTQPGVPIRDYYKAIADAERRSGVTLTGETFKDEKGYAKVAAPWAKTETTVGDVAAAINRVVANRRGRRNS